MEACNSLFDVLEEIYKRPGMFLGDGTYEQQLSVLESIIRGYNLALRVHGVDEEGTHFSQKFADFLRAKYSWSMSCGPFYAIKTHTNCGKDYWDKFWELIEEFKADIYRHTT